MGNRPTTIPAGTGAGTQPIRATLQITGGATAQYPIGNYNFNPPVSIETLIIAPMTNVVLTHSSGNTNPLQNATTQDATYKLGGYTASAIRIDNLGPTPFGGSGLPTGGASSPTTEGFSTGSSGWMWVAIILAIILIALIIYFYKKGQIPMLNKKTVPAGVGYSAAPMSPSLMV
jgi:hypothetical protein